MKATSASSASAKPYMGYNFASAVAGNFIPQRVQNLCIREYARAKNLALSFSIAEYSDATRSLMLFAQFGHTQAFAGFIFYSVLLLPGDPGRRKEFYERVACLGKPVHFALEDLCLSSASDRETIERVFRISLDPRLDQTRATLLAMRAKAEKRE